QVCGGIVAFITPEAAQNADLNGDGDQNDRVLQLFDPSTQTLINTGQAAEEFVCSASLIAFRTSEAAQAQTDLNGDADTSDFVLQVYTLDGSGCLNSAFDASCLINTGQAVTPCKLEACDPRVPYRALSHTVRFLTLEADQRQDLNADGDQGDLVLQVFN